MQAIQYHRQACLNGLFGWETVPVVLSQTVQSGKMHLGHRCSRIAWERGKERRGGEGQEKESGGGGQRVGNKF